MSAPILQFKRGNAGVGGTVPALYPGEPAISLNNFDFFIGIDTSVANNKFFGSHRYWGREDGTNSLKLKLVDKDGTNYVALKTPDTLAGNITYVLPGTQGASSSVLTNDGSGNLTWASGSANPIFSGIATFTDTTDNTLGDPNTGAVQIDGGLGVNKNVTVGAGLSVIGESHFIGTATFYGGQINLGDSDGDNISVAGEFVSNLVPNATNTYDLGLTGKRWRDGFFSGNLDVTGNLIVDGTATIGGGTTVILYGQDVLIKNKDIILGYTTSITNEDASTDITANHAGVAIASTVGTPLASFAASGINTLPDTYKQLMWFKQGTLGFGTDTFAFNYGVAIGTTNMADGVRLAVGTGVTVSDTSVSATNFYGALTGNASSSDQVKTVTASDNNATYYVTFVDANNGSATNETVYTDDGIYYNPGANKLTTQNADFTGNVLVSGITTLAGNVNLGDSGSDVISVAGFATFSQSVYVGGTLTIGSVTIGSTTGGTSVGEDISTRNINASGIATVTGLLDVNGGADITGHSELDDVNVSGVTTTGTLRLAGTSGIGITGISASTTLAENSNDYLPTQAAVKAYVDAVDLTTGIAGDSGTGSVSTSQTLTVAGTANEIETSASGQTITVGLPDAVIVGTSLSAPTIRTNIIQSQNTGATVFTLTADDAQVSGDFTVGGNLYVNGNTTQVNTTALTVEDRTIDLGIVDGAAPASNTTWDLGVLFNYYSGGAAKKSAVVWEHGDSRFKFASVLGADTNGSTNDTPQLTVTTFAPIEVAELWVNNTCTGGSQQVIGCVGAELQLQNITIDAGVF